MARDEFTLSEPPRRITALPAFRVSAPASAVTLGRLSKMTPITPRGVDTRRMVMPLGRLHCASSRPTGSGSSAMVRSPSIMASMRLSLSCRRSRKALEMPLPSAARMSRALAERMSSRRSSMASAAACSAFTLLSGEAKASTAAAARARRPSSSMTVERSTAATALIRLWPPGPSAPPCCRGGSVPTACRCRGDRKRRGSSCP